MTVDFNPYDLFGGLIANLVPIFDLKWFIDPEDEKRCYVRKDLTDKFNAKFPKWVPHNHFYCILWFKEATVAFQQIDVTTDMTVVEWWRVIESFPDGLSEMDVIYQLDNCGCQGLVLLSRHLSGVMSQSAYMKDPMFGH